MSLAHLQYDRVARMHTALEMAQVSLSAAYREQWMELDGGEPLRADKVAAEIGLLIDGVQRQLKFCEEHRERLLRAAVKER